ncbi:MAG: hypothetical protein KOO66_09630 [Bacteroidales bacterium]|nr:hypothetical protein [Bacteroidales bacterium]
MKKPFFFILLIAFLSILTACSDDDDDPIPENTETGKVTIEGVEYTLVFGEMFHGEYSVCQGYGYDIILMAADTSSGMENTTYLDFMMQIEFYSATTGQLSPGVYTFDLDETGAVGCFGNGILVTGWDEETWTANYFFSPTGGTFTVAKSGDYYTLTLNVITDKHEGTDEPLESVFVEGNVLISGYFTGKLEQKYSGK